MTQLQRNNYDIFSFNKLNKIRDAISKADYEIKRTILTAIAWNSDVELNKIDVRVQNGWVILIGEIKWKYQKSRIRNLAADVKGVVGITNLIQVSAQTAKQTGSSLTENLDHDSVYDLE
jgi:osmotically-inducible protein OsmY